MNPNPNPEPLSDAALARLVDLWLALGPKAGQEASCPEGDPHGVFIAALHNAFPALMSRLRLAEAQLRGVHDGVAQARALLEDEGELDPNPAEAMNVLKEVMDIIIYPDEALDIIAARAAEEDTDAR
jgi:hypothetical protein